MNISVDHILPVSNGEEAEISMVISNGRESQRLKGRVSAAMFAELGLPLTLASPLAVSRERCEEILRCMKLHAAVKKGIYLLGYARNTAKSLEHKLKTKGYSDDIAREAVNYLKEKGYIREKDDALLFAENLAYHKFYGKNRIRKELFSKGFPEDVIRETMELLEIDFSELCAERIRSMGGIGIFETPEEKSKAISALLRYGFSYHEIRGATEVLRGENE